MTDPVLTFVNQQAQQQIPISDRGLAYGDGVFETMLVMNRSIPLLSLHLDRLHSGLRVLGIDLYRGQLEQHLAMIQQAIEDSPCAQGIYKLILTRGQGGRGYQVDQDVSANLISQLFPKRLSPREHLSAEVHICQQRIATLPGLAGLKTLNQLPYVLATRERFGTVFNEGLLLSTDDRLIEATSRNLFILSKQRLLTPDLQHGGVAGVMRRLMLEELVAKCGLQSEVRSLTMADLEQADEVFLTNAVTGIWPVIACQHGNQHMTWSVGPVTQSLQSALTDFLECKLKR